MLAFCAFWCNYNSNATAQIHCVAVHFFADWMFVVND